MTTKPSAEQVNEARDKAYRLKDRAFGQRPHPEALEAYRAYADLVRQFEGGRVPPLPEWWAIPPYAPNHKNDQLKKESMK